MAKDNPEDLKDLNTVKITGVVKDFVNNLATKVDEEKTARAFWDQQIDRYTNLRYGIRGKKTQS